MSEEEMRTRTKDERFGCASGSIMGLILGKAEERYSDAPN